MSSFSWMEGGGARSSGGGAASSKAMAAASSSSTNNNEDGAGTGGPATPANTADRQQNQNNTNTNSMLRFATVDQVSSYSGSEELAEIVKQLQFYGHEDRKLASAYMAKADPEYQFVLECGTTCVRIEQEKMKIHKFIQDHYARRFPELAVLVQDSTTFARVVKLLGNNIHDADKVMEPLLERLPSQLLGALIAAACTTKGTELPEQDMNNILDACDELTCLEDVKQELLKYIQQKMIFLCRNLCAFLGPGIASQLVATAGSVDALSQMSQEQVMELGAYRAQKIGFAVKTKAGFILNVDLVAAQPAQLRTRALRLVADKVVQLARFDANREGADESEGLGARAYVIRRSQSWSDPLVQEAERKKHGQSNKLYEKRARAKKGDVTDVRRYTGGVGAGGGSSAYGAAAAALQSGMRRQRNE